MMWGALLEMGRDDKTKNHFEGRNAIAQITVLMTKMSQRLFVASSSKLVINEVEPEAG